MRLTWKRRVRPLEYDSVRRRLAVRIFDNFTGPVASKGADVAIILGVDGNTDKPPKLKDGSLNAPIAFPVEE